MKLSEMPVLEAVLIVAARQAGSRVRNLQAQQRPVDSSILIPVQEFLEAHDPVYEKAPPTELNEATYASGSNETTTGSSSLW